MELLLLVDPQFNTAASGDISIKTTVSTESYQLTLQPGSILWLTLPFLAGFHYERKLPSRCLRLTSFKKKKRNVKESCKNVPAVGSPGLKVFLDILKTGSSL